MPKKHVCTAQEVVNAVLDKPIRWVPYQDLPADKRQEWSNYARSALTNPALQSLIGVSGVVSKDPCNGEIVKNMIEDIARRSGSFDQVTDMRMVIIGIELVRTMLEEAIIVDRPNKTVEEPNAAM